MAAVGGGGEALSFLQGCSHLEATHALIGSLIPRHILEVLSELVVDLERST